MTKETNKRAFAALINGAGQVLVVKRARTTNNGGQIGLPGGHLNEGETVDEGCSREVFEEIGVSIDFKSVPVLRVQADDKRTIIFACIPKPSTYAFNLDTNEVESVQWVDWTDLSNFPYEALHRSVLLCQRVLNPATGIYSRTLWEVLKGEK